MAKSCQTCRYWKPPTFEWYKNGTCEKIRETLFVRSEDTNTYIDTPPDFACNLFTSLKKKDKK